jgi:hypothetical protein
MLQKLLICRTFLALKIPTEPQTKTKICKYKTNMEKDSYCCHHISTNTKHHHQAVQELGHWLTHSGLSHPEDFLKFSSVA